jgi:hypothetical protein
VHDPCGGSYTKGTEVHEVGEVESYGIFGSQKRLFYAFNTILNQTEILPNYTPLQRALPTSAHLATSNETLSLPANHVAIKPIFTEINL